MSTRSALALLRPGPPLSRGEFILLWATLLGAELVARGVAGAVYLGGWPPTALLQPYWMPRSGAILEPLPWQLLLHLVLITIPIAWMGAMITGRRAKAVGLSPFVGLGAIVPVLAALVVLVLACMPASPAGERAVEELSSGPRRWAAPGRIGRSWTRRIVAGLIVSVALLAVVFFSSQLGDYGSVLFLASPVIFGAIVGYLANFERTMTLAETLGLTSGLVCAGLFTLVLVAIEGFVCVFMALPIVLPMALVGAMLGRTLALNSYVPDRSFGLIVLVLPFSGWVQSQVEPPAAREVTTAVEIDAPPEVVWKHVIRFSELPEAKGFLFDTGIAYPVRARLEGEGVGAVRHCEFTTGAFVEPITAWEPPRRLSFDVVAQPHPMEEWSFYSRVEPPHLEESFRSVRGEFRLIELPDGRTRLEGSTWYHLDIGPVAYWQLWTDWILHRIHLRVLRHVARLSEETQAGALRTR